MQKTKNKSIAGTKQFTKLNLGCGMDILDSFLNVDILPHNDKVMKLDLGKPLPFRNNTFEFIKAHNVLEHINRNFDDLLYDIWRISRPNAIIDIEVPHFSSGAAYCSTHTRFFRCDEFEPYKCNRQNTDSNHHNKHFTSYYPFNFEVIETNLCFNKGKNPLDYIGRIFNLNRKLRLIFDSTFVHNIFLASTVKYRLKVIK